MEQHLRAASASDGGVAFQPMERPAPSFGAFLRLCCDEDIAPARETNRRVLAWSIRCIAVTPSTDDAICCTRVHTLHPLSPNASPPPRSFDRQRRTNTHTRQAEARRRYRLYCAALGLPAAEFGVQEPLHEPGEACDGPPPPPRRTLLFGLVFYAIFCLVTVVVMCSTAMRSRLHGAAKLRFPVMVEVPRFRLRGSRYRRFFSCVPMHAQCATPSPRGVCLDLLPSG